MGELVTNVLVILVGVFVAVMSSRQMVEAFQTGNIRLRGGRVVNRASHPNLFWVNFAALVLACIVGCGLIVWALKKF